MCIRKVSPHEPLPVKHFFLKSFSVVMILVMTLIFIFEKGMIINHKNSANDQFITINDYLLCILN